MDEKISERIVPEQYTGSKTDVNATIEFDTIEEADEFFKQAKSRLININNWHHISENASTTFKLTDNTGNEITREPQVGDYFKIDIPGPGTITGEGYDWVKIENITSNKQPENETEITAIQVRPAESPVNTKHDVAHFFTDEATSSFIVKRTGKTVTAEVHGRNEKPNTHADALVDKTRNTMVAVGAVAGFSSIQWKGLVNGIIGK